MSDEPELRRDPICGRWVLVAPRRAARPIALDDSGARHRTSGERTPCPFCPGEEHDTPREVYAVREPGSPPDGPGWRLRVVPNKFPAVRGEEPNPPSPFPKKEGGGALFDTSDRELSLSTVGAVEEQPESAMDAPPPSFLGKGDGGLGCLPLPALGSAEVLIDCPEHLDSPTHLSDGQLADVFVAYRERMTALAADPRLEHVAVFKNVGAEAGASLGHSHSQIIATTVVPLLIQQELAGAEAHFARAGRCAFCDLAKGELADGSRVVARTANFVAVTAFAPRFSYEMWVLPLRHEPRYEAVSDGAARELAGLVRRVLRALDSVCHSPAYNWFLHTTPLRGGEPPHYHWHLEILPRTARPAGLEWGFGCHITTAAPERAAAELRAALPAAG